MAAEQRKLLEQLMGQELMNGVPSKPQVAITDPKVCRSYLVGTCPYDLFTNTKQDWGICPKVHSQALKDEYDAADDKQKKRWGFEFDYLRELARYVDDCNRRIDVAQKRLDKTPEEMKQTHALLKQISDLTEAINIGLDEVKFLSDGGAVNMAVSEFFKLRQAKQQKEELERELKMLSDTSGPSGHQKLQVCDVCGAYLSRLDNDRRLADHFYGKMHLGYAQMRRTHETLAAELKGKQAPPRAEERSQYGQDGDQSRNYGRHNGYGGGRRGGGHGRGRRGGYYGGF